MLKDTEAPQRMNKINLEPEIKGPSNSSKNFGRISNIFASVIEPQ
jgi:hypothetical protein